MKKEYLYLAIAGIILYIIVQNRKDEGGGTNIGGGIWDEKPIWEDTKPAPAPTPNDYIDNNQRNLRIGEGLII